MFNQPTVHQDTEEITEPAWASGQSPKELSLKDGVWTINPWNSMIYRFSTRVPVHPSSP